MNVIGKGRLPNLCNVVSLNRRRLIVICRLAPLLAMMVLTACAKPYIQPSPGEHTAAQLTESYALMEDGYRLPLSQWPAVRQTRAVVLALHGLNDYSIAFDNLGRYLSDHGITVIAYDQRGFGTTAGHGLWHGSERLSGDLFTMTRLLREHYSDTPLYVLGESMGGAVVLSSLASTSLDIDGSVLVAPAVWARQTMPYYQRAALWLAAHTFPDKRLTGKNLDITPSDNIDMLRALHQDDRVIKATRVDVLYGISNLMDKALERAGDVSGNMLFLYGRHDDIIPALPTCELYGNLTNAEHNELTAILYQDGYHMLTRDLQAHVVLQDIATWIDESALQTNTNNSLLHYCATQAKTE